MSTPYLFLYILVSLLYSTVPRYSDYSIYVPMLFIDVQEKETNAITPVGPVRHFIALSTFRFYKKGK